MLNQKFKVGILFTLEEDFTIQFSKKGKVTTRTQYPSFKNKPPETHDKPKERRAELGKYLNLLGIIDENGVVVSKMADKYKQINKYLEIIENLMKNADLSKTISIVDMGSGKGLSVSHGTAWDIAKKHYIVYKTNGNLEFWNGGDLKKTYVWGTGKSVNFQTSHHINSSTLNNQMTNLRMKRREWDGTKYIN